jgi:hypothetical protein
VVGDRSAGPDGKKTYTPTNNGALMSRPIAASSARRSRSTMRSTLCSWMNRASPPTCSGSTPAVRAAPALRITRPAATGRRTPSWRPFGRPR